MTTHSRRRGRHGRHDAGYKHRGTLRMIRGGALWLLLAAGVFTVGAIAQPLPSQAGTLPHRTPVTQYAPGRVLPRPLADTSRQPLCTRSQDGEYAVVVAGGGRFAFAARCLAVRDGSGRYAWVALS